MGDSSDKDNQRKEDKLRVEILTDVAEKYRIMAHIFFRRLDDKEKIDALIEAALQIREEVLYDKRKD